MPRYSTNSTLASETRARLKAEKAASDPKLSYHDIALKLGMSEVQVVRRFSGVVAIDLDEADALAGVFGYPGLRAMLDSKAPVAPKKAGGTE